MAQIVGKLGWKEILEKYPDEWVLLTDYEPDLDFDGKGIIAQKGQVLVHAKTRDEFNMKVKEVDCPNASITYAGDLIPDGFRGLWELRK